MSLFCNLFQIPHELTELNMKNKADRKRDIVMALAIFGGLLLLFGLLSWAL